MISLRKAKTYRKSTRNGSSKKSGKRHWTEDSRWSVNSPQPTSFQSERLEWLTMPASNKLSDLRNFAKMIKFVSVPGLRVVASLFILLLRRFMLQPFACETSCRCLANFCFDDDEYRASSSYATEFCLRRRCFNSGMLARSCSINV